MAAKSGGNFELTYSNHSNRDILPKDKMEQKYVDLMERIRNKTSQLRSWAEASKNIKMSLSDKRHMCDIQDRPQLQRCLDKLQKAVKVAGLQSMVDKLECIARGAGIKFSQNGTNSYFSLEEFYILVAAVPTGAIKDVTIAHGNANPMSCPQLVKILNDGDFEEFSAHLKGIAEIYQLNGDKKVKNSKIYLSLQSLESDLANLAQCQRRECGINNYIHKSPLGMLKPRVGGRAMKLTYFVSPYHLLDVKSNTSHELTLDAVGGNQLGHSVTIGLESSTPHKLQTMPLLTLTKSQDGKSNLPSITSNNQMNSMLMPAVFVLRLDRPIPLALSLIRKIQQSTNIDIGMNQGKSGSLVSLIWEDMTGKPWQTSKEAGISVHLPDQHHKYYLNSGWQGSDELNGICISTIPFCHPTHVPNILVYLRQQLLFNTIIGSCMRHSNKPDTRDPIVFEVNPMSLQHITLMFEHPLQDSMASAEFELSDVVAVKCRLFTQEDCPSICDEDIPCTYIQRSLSIPVTMRGLMIKAAEQLTVQSRGLTITAKQFISKHEPMELPGQDINLMSPPFHNTMHTAAYNARTSLLAEQLSESGGYGGEKQPQERVDKISKNPMLASLLDSNDTNNPPDSGPNQSMLSVLLGDQSSALPNPMAAPPMKPRKPRMSRKSRTSTDKSPLSSPAAKRQRKMSQDEINKELMQMEVEPSNTFDMGLQPPMQGTEESNISHVSKLASSLDSIIKQEGKPGVPSVSPATQMEIMSDTEIKREKVSPSPSPRSTPSKHRPASSSSSLDDIISNVHDVESDMFTNKDGHFTPTDFMTAAQQQRGGGGGSGESSLNGHQSLDFNTELLNPDPHFTENLIPPSEESLDMAACDASAFGTGNTVALLASKMATKGTNKASSSSSSSNHKHRDPKKKKVPTATLR